MIKAEVPLARCSATRHGTLKTQGRATYTMEFHSYQEVPNSIAEEIKAKVGR